jgi:hypothetical protein
MPALRQKQGSCREPPRTCSSPQGRLPSRRNAHAVATGTTLRNFPFTLPHELAAGQRRQLRELGQAAWRTFLLHYYRGPDTGRRRPLVTDLLTSLTLNLRSSQRQCPVIPGIRAAFGIRGADRALIGLVLVATGAARGPAVSAKVAARELGCARGSCDLSHPSVLGGRGGRRIGSAAAARSGPDGDRDDGARWAVRHVQRRVVFLVCAASARRGPRPVGSILDTGGLDLPSLARRGLPT